MAASIEPPALPLREFLPFDPKSVVYVPPEATLHGLGDARLRVVQELTLEQIGDDLCLVVKTSESRFRGILGAIDPDIIRSFGERAAAIAEAYERRNGIGFKASLYEI